MISLPYDSTNPDRFVDYNHFITTQPYSINRLFVSDLHLSKDEPALVQAFYALLEDCIALPNLKEFYILGDWFDVWIGDDAYLSLSTAELNHHWLSPIIKQLKKLSKTGCIIKVMHGNRDFLIGSGLCELFNGQLIFEPYYLKIGNSSVRLEHGDALCTDDVAYQRMRKILRFKLVKRILLTRPLSKRQKLADTIKNKSRIGKENKPQNIMDVNSSAVKNALHGVDTLLHGHTHRPDIHHIELSSTLIKTRYVLGDWRIRHSDSRSQFVNAIVAVSTIKNDDKQINTLNNSASLKPNQHNNSLKLLSYCY